MLGKDDDPFKSGQLQDGMFWQVDKCQMVNALVRVLLVVVVGSCSYMKHPRLCQGCYYIRKDISRKEGCLIDSRGAWLCTGLV